MPAHGKQLRIDVHSTGLGWQAEVESPDGLEGSFSTTEGISLAAMLKRIGEAVEVHEIAEKEERIAAGAQARAAEARRACEALGLRRSGP